MGGLTSAVSDQARANRFATEVSHDANIEGSFSRERAGNGAAARTGRMYTRQQRQLLRA